MNVNTMNDLKRTLPEVEPAERKVDDCRILFFHEYVLGEPSEVENNIRRKLLTLVSSQSTRIFLRWVGYE